MPFLGWANIVGIVLVAPIGPSLGVGPHAILPRGIVANAPDAAADVRVTVICRRHASVSIFAMGEPNMRTIKRKLMSAGLPRYSYWPVGCTAPNPSRLPSPVRGRTTQDFPALVDVLEKRRFELTVGGQTAFLGCE